jgi:hypothetical protein
MNSLVSFVAVFVAGFFLGYGIRAIISQKHRAKARRRRRFFYDGPLPTDNCYSEYLSERAKTTKSSDAASNRVQTTAQRNDTVERTNKKDRRIG